ncbi:MAG TPA: hypothetical protein VGG64_00775 [Pirellulales bacterium]|jgi:hypothetical protein
MSQEKTLVVILSMHRCGSSLTARLFQHLGMSLGPFELGEANDSNKYGHFEAQPFVLLNREFQLKQFGFEGDLPDDPDTFRRYCDRDGRWNSEDSISDEAIARGRGVVDRLMQSGTICGFKDPRTVQVWPFWQRVFEGLPALRVVPLFLIRGPHEIAMSLFRRSQGERDYAQALQVSAIHFRRMKDILDQWSGPAAVVQFEPQIYSLQARQAAELCGLLWSDTALAEAYDASCRHHEASTIDDPAQWAFEALAHLPPGMHDAENFRRLLADSEAREAILRKTRELRRQERDAAQQTAALLQNENTALRQAATEAVPPQPRRTQATCPLDLDPNSRRWRSLNGQGRALKIRLRAYDDQRIRTKHQPNRQDVRLAASSACY